MQLNGYKGNNMSLGGSSSSQQQLDPAMRDAFLQNVTSAQDVAAGLKAREFAGFNADQQQAFALNRLYASPLSAPTLYATDAANILKQGAQYTPQNVAYNAYGGTTVDPAALAAQQGYTAAQFGGATTGPAAQFGGASAGAAERAQAAQFGRSNVRDVAADRITAERIAAAQANRAGARDVSATGVTGAQVTSEALGQIAPQARQNIRDIEAASFLNQNIQQYMNPYTQAVTNQSLQDLERSRQLQQQQTAAQATAARAYGGSRQGVAEAETNRAFGENAARLVAQQNAAAYQAAQQASEADLARTMQSQQLNQAQDAATTQQALQLAGQFGLANQDANLRAALANQGVDVQYGLSNAQLQQQAALANQSTGLAAAQANQDANLRAALSNQGYDFNVGQMNTMNQQAANLANQAAANQMAQFNAGNLQQAGLANMGALNQTAQFNAGNLQQAGLSNQQALNQAGQFGASAFNQAGLANQAALNARAAQQAGLTQQTGLTNAENFLQANLANQQAGLAANQQRITGGSQLASAATNLQNLGFGQANQLTQQGLLQQGFSQQQLDAIRNLPLEQQQIINQALGINVGGGSGVQSSSSSGQGLFGLFR